ncbi:MAG TPA: 50S ribosomal protein L24 [Candidatus Portnoybacteria bacterium]|uniref:Large ribosomal subunit protein uL24 n=1 Tax=Candidatus Portnoybacteria bacterium CG02_land_8_20_14_3_00_45_8 TaxID=1974807 RepID=A0A2M7D6B5_9BACT|nr:MAG: 50S ribosomal protein L24 [Candidatus Portnoybacteria bacterium CG02_land_8_20_14_3_00_45_8]HCX27550.1 50S ribosomal protein L24 [Candidatus Portnoybacteria bacterium]
MKIKKNDQVLIMTGKDKGKSGKVLQVWPVASRITVGGVNLVKKHKRGRRSGEKGQIVEVSKSLHASNVLLLCPKCGQGARIGYKITAAGKLRFCKKCQQEI